MDFFSGRKLVIATKHQKETVIAQKAASRLGVLPFVAPALDTDLLGTFSGEVERTLDPLSAARKKCELAMELTGADLAIASEGSFGPHPLNFLIPGDEEIVMLLDKKNGFEIAGKKVSIETNFGGQLCSTETELHAFADSSGFPSHGLILRDSKDGQKEIYKGICSREKLTAKFRVLVDRYGHAYAETDMRALFNPMRMKVIGEATDVMLEKALTLCERCSAPGFGITHVKAGLRCSQCGLPTKSTAAYVHTCSKCGFNREQKNSVKLVEEPMYCDFCNP